MDKVYQRKTFSSKRKAQQAAKKFSQSQKAEVKQIGTGYGIYAIPVEKLPFNTILCDILEDL